MTTLSPKQDIKSNAFFVSFTYAWISALVLLNTNEFETDSRYLAADYWPSYCQQFKYAIMALNLSVFKGK